MNRKHIVKFLICSLILISAVLSISMPALADDWTAYIPSQGGFTAFGAKAAILADTATGEILWAQNADVELAPASTAKMMTALLVIEAVERGEASLSDIVTVTQEMIDSLPYDASTMSVPVEDGEEISVLDLLYAVMVVSDCQASNVLAYYISGSVEGFNNLMNTRAAELGCTSTVFTNPSGYPDDAMYTTARSLYLILAEGIKHELFRTLSSTVEYTVAKTNLNEERKLKSGNRLLSEAANAAASDNGNIYSYYYPYAISSKNGYSTPAGICLASAAEKDGYSLVAVVLGAENAEDSNGVMTANRYIDTIKMFEYGFSVLQYRVIRLNMTNEKMPQIIKNTNDGEFNSMSAINADAQILADFQEKCTQEGQSREELIRYCVIALTSVTAFGITILLITIKNRRKKKNF